MTAPTLFISDLHLSPKRPRSNQQFIEFLEQDALNAAALYILGDLFDFWIGDDAAEALGQTWVLEQLNRYSRQQRNLYFMRGNRDFLVGEEFADKSGCRLIDDESVVILDNEKVLLMHGDSLCTDDADHQAFRTMVLDPGWQQHFLSLPVEERLRLATDVRTRSELHKSMTSMEIMDVNPDAVEKVMQRHKVARLIHGHTHRPAIHSHQLHEHCGERIVLGDWYGGSSVLLVEQGQYRLRTTPTTRDSAASA